MNKKHAIEKVFENNFTSKIIETRRKGGQKPWEMLKKITR